MGTNRKSLLEDMKVSIDVKRFDPEKLNDNNF